MKNIFRIFMLSVAFFGMFAPLNCLNQEEFQKLNEITRLYSDLILKSANSFLEQIKETKENDFICFKLSEELLLAKEHLMLKILDCPVLFISKKTELIKSIIKQIRPFFSCSTQNSEEKEARKLALFYAISSFENGVSSLVKDSNAEDYVKNKENAKNETIKFVPIFIISVLVHKFSKDWSKDNTWKRAPKFIGYGCSIFFGGISIITIITSWPMFFLSTLRCSKEVLKSIKMRYQEQTNLDILNRPVIKTEFKKSTGQKYVSDETLLRIFGS